MAGTLRHYLILNFTVFVWGFTGVLGKEIDLAANEIVFFRMGIAFFSLILIQFFYRKIPGISIQQIIYLTLAGIVVGLHWYCFFGSIKLSTVSVGVVCMSSATLFTAILEPLILKRKIALSELVLSFVIIIGIVLIIGFEPEYVVGISVGLMAAFLAALFGVLNGKFIRTIHALHITKFEMLGGFLTMFAILWFEDMVNPDLFVISSTNWIYLLILGLVCTTAAFLISVWLMKFLSPFTVSMGLNMEPIYAILIALTLGAIRGEDSEKMSAGFYFGTILILGSIFLNAYLKKKKKVA